MLLKTSLLGPFLTTGPFGDFVRGGYGDGMGGRAIYPIFGDLGRLLCGGGG